MSWEVFPYLQHQTCSTLHTCSLNSVALSGRSQQYFLPWGTFRRKSVGWSWNGFRQRRMSNTSAEKQQTTRKYWVSKCSTESATELKCQREIKVGCCGLTLNAECGWNLGFISAWNCFSWLCSVSLLCSEAWSSEAIIFKGKLCSGGLHACKSWFSFIWALDEPSLACFWSALKMSKNNPSKQHLISLFGLLPLLLAPSSLTTGPVRRRSNIDSGTKPWGRDAEKQSFIPY